MTTPISNEGCPRASFSGFSNQEIEHPLFDFNFEMRISDDSCETIRIGDAASVERLLQTLQEEIRSSHSTVTLGLDYSQPRVDLENFIRYLEQMASSEGLQFCGNRLYMIYVQPKASEIEELDEVTTRRKYPSGVTETFSFNVHRTEYQGRRIFPDGKIENGSFCQDTGRLKSGYRIGVDKKIDFLSPPSFVRNGDLEIVEVEGKLVVLKTNVEGYRHYQTICDTPILEIVLKSYENGGPKNKNLKKVLLHEDFQSHLKLVVENALAPDEKGTPNLFRFSVENALAILEAGSKIMDLNLNTIIDPNSVQIFFMHIAFNKNEEVLFPTEFLPGTKRKYLKKLAQIFPDAFLSVGQRVIVESLLHGTFLSRQIHTREIQPLVEEFERLGGRLEPFPCLLWQVANRIKPDEHFIETFASLSDEQKQMLFKAAYTHNNPYLYETPDVPVRANQYSVNFLWINPCKMAEEQEFLCAHNFQDTFVKPLADWVRKNPESPINIWFDSAMATERAIERSREALFQELEGTPHNNVCFRDIRTIDIVQTNANIFNEQMALYFRIDLLKAITADHVLRNKETQYVVQSDLDVTPLSRQELFDKRTVSFLKEYGFAMAKGGILGFENCFQMFNGDNTQLMESHRKVIIDFTIEMVNTYPEELKVQQIYDTYPAMLTHWLEQDGRYGSLWKDEQFVIGSISIPKSKDPDVIYHYNTFHNAAHRYLPFGDHKILQRDVMPKKPVIYPPSHFGHID
ncbi:hypothetical protein JYU14_00100 [Simkania negevensis]|uniref:Uncharacterized protein n=1 Tax=Simkania negevensis TaxID=83561 RepID=A0ABS3ATZ1_9BACT|nr:hypothetical protein [Simkania negevensis]